MARIMYSYVLRRNKPGWFFTGSTTPTVSSRGEAWFDLEDEPGTLERIAEEIRTHNGSEAEIGQYRLEISDPDTGERIRSIAPSFADLKAARDGRRPVQRTSSTEPSLANYSHDQILAELRRRLGSG